MFPQNLHDSLLLVSLTCWILASGSLWWQIGLRLRVRQPPLPLCECPRTPPSAIIVPVTLGIWVTGQLVATGFMIAFKEEPLSQVQGHCLSSVLILVLLSVVLTSGESGSVSQFGIQLARWKADLIDGARGFLASVLPVGLVLAATHPLRSSETQHSLLKLLREHPGPETTAWIALGAVVLAPLAEELVYRVILQGWLQSRIEPAWAISAVAVLFALVHPWPDSLPLIPLALILGYVYYRRHSYLAVVMLHLLFNATNLAFALLAQQAEALRSAAAL